MPTSSYSNLFGTNGAGQQGSQPGIGTLFGQQPRPQETEEERQRRQQPAQTFAQLQRQGLARPAPQAPEGQAFERYGGSQQAQQARTGMLGALQQQLAAPTRFDTQAFQQIRQAQSAQLGAEYQAEQGRLNEELARRGLSASSIGGGRMGDLAGQQARALAQLDAQLLQQAAQTQAQDRLAALQAAGQFAELAGAQDLSQFEANRVAQAAEFEQALRQAQFGQQQTEFERGQALQAAQAQQAGQEAAMERRLREQLGLGGLGIQREEMVQRRAEALSQQTGTVYEIGPDGTVVQRLVNGQPVRTESALARLSQQQLQQAELTGSYTNADGTTVSTLAAQRLSQENLRTLMEQAAQRSQLTGQMHRVDDNGQIVLDTDAQGQPISTESRRAQMVQEANVTRQQAQAQAEARTQQTGLSFIVGPDGTVTADIDPATGRQRTTAQAQQFQAQLNQQRELAAAELTGTITVNGQPVSTVAAQRLGQERLQLAIQQAAQLSQQTGNVYEVNEDGQVAPKMTTDKDGKSVPLKTESALARLSAERLQQAELTGVYTDANGVPIDTIAAKQLSQAQLAQLAEQAARQSQLTGFMYKVGVDSRGNPIVEQQFVTDADGKTVAVSTESARAQLVQEANVARQIAQARAEALSQQSGLSYTVNSNNEIVPDKDPATGNQRTTVQAQQLAEQRRQSDLDRTLRERLGAAEFTGMYDGRQTMPARQAQQNLLIQLAGVLAGGGTATQAQMPALIRALYTAFGIPTDVVGGGGGGGGGGDTGGGGTGGTGSTGGTGGTGETDRTGDDRRYL